MSLAQVEQQTIARGFPRVSGDEPRFAQERTAQLPFSPRERG